MYLVHAWARSRAGFNNVLSLIELSAEGTRPIGEGRVLIDGNALPGYSTLEGPKLYKRGGWYYVFAPAGGVKQGWQSVFRARAIGGPYQARIALAQGGTAVNGPHQGALVDSASGESWFLHFQDREAYGRIVHLQPVTWKDGWPIIGDDSDGDGTGSPVAQARKPQGASSTVADALQASDEFDRPQVGLAWQWQANPAQGWSTLAERRGFLRLHAIPREGNLWMAGNLLLQKLPAPEFAVTAALDVSGLPSAGVAGLIVFGCDYAWIGIQRAATGSRLVVRVTHSADKGAPEQEVASARLERAVVHVRMTMAAGAVARFSYSPNNVGFTAIGDAFTAKPGRWVGAKVGLFASTQADANSAGHAEFDWFRITAR